MLIMWSPFASSVPAALFTLRYNCVYASSEICSASAFDSLPICTAFVDFEFMNWNAESNTEVLAIFLAREPHNCSIDKQ